MSSAAIESQTKVNWVYYILATYVPLAAIFVAIMVFNVRLTSGPVNSFIFHAQVVTIFDISGYGQIQSSSINAISAVYKTFYGLFNLQVIAPFLPPFCLSSSFNTLDVLAVKYVEAVFPLLVLLSVVLFIQLQKCLGLDFNCCARRVPCAVGNSLAHSFAAFVLLSYINFCLVSTYLTASQTLTDGNQTQVGPRVLTFQGTVTTTSPLYRQRYALLALFVLMTFIAIPPLLLLQYPLQWFEYLITKASRLNRLYPHVTVKILLDTFQGCYKDNRRYFAGLYLLVRVALYFIYWIVDRIQDQYLLQQILLVVCILAIGVLRPYRNPIFNYVDMAIFTNMAAISILTSYVVQWDGPGLPMNAIYMQYCLVFLPTVYLAGYLTWYAVFTSKKKTNVCHRVRKYRDTLRDPGEDEFLVDRERCSLHGNN